MQAERRIAVIDDDAGSRLSMVALLRSFGCSAQAFESAHAYLADPSGHWGCIISDINMPSMDGYQLLSTVKAGDRPPPVILVTAYSTPNARSNAHEAGAAGFFEKPVDDVLLMDCLAKIFEDQR